MSHPITDPPEQPGLIWVTHAHDGEIPGYWSPETRFQVVNNGKGIWSGGTEPWRLALYSSDEITHWRPLDEPDGEVTWEVENLSGSGLWCEVGLDYDRTNKASAERAIAYLRRRWGFTYRLTKVTRRVVEGPNEEEGGS